MLATLVHCGHPTIEGSGRAFSPRPFTVPGDLGVPGGISARVRGHGGPVAGVGVGGGGSLKGRRQFTKTESQHNICLGKRPFPHGHALQASPEQRSCMNSLTECNFGRAGTSSVGYFLPWWNVWRWLAAGRTRWGPGWEEGAEGWEGGGEGVERGEGVGVGGTKWALLSPPA